MQKFEIGLIYRKDSKLYLSIEEHRVVTFMQGKPKCVKPYLNNKTHNFEVVRGMTVEELCERWKLSIEDFDKELSPFFAPSSEGLKTNSRNRRKARKENEHLSQTMRTARIAMCGTSRRAI